MGLLTILKKVKEEEREIRLLILGLDNAGKTTVVRRFLGQDVKDVEPTLGFSIHTLEYALNATASNELDEADDGQSNNIHDISPNANAAELSATLEDQTNSACTDKKHEQHQEATTLNADAFQRSQRQDQQQQQQVYQLHLWDIGGQSSIRSYWRNYFEKTDGLVFVIDSSDGHRLDLVEKELSSLLQQERLQGATLLVLANKQDLKNSLTAKEIADRLMLTTKIQYQNRHWAIYGCSAFTGEGLPDGMEWLVQDIASRIFFLD